ncbi:MAG: hybrid sensor histidine kinase/response regulator [Sphingomonas bacterium]|nr:hybrid sensor histidine kinase/response regulator [Sphingomonas bacterium]
MMTGGRKRPDFLSADGEMARLIEGFDWQATAIGPMEGWSQTLCVTIGVILRSPVPMVTLWGDDGIMIYNDAYAVFSGSRHPSLLGSRVREGWDEVADFNDNVMTTGLAGGALSYRDQELTLLRSGQPEQVWMNLDYSPVVGEDGVPIGVIAIVVETTAKVRAERTIAGERDRLRLMFEEAPGFMATLVGPDHILEIANPAYRRLVGDRDLIGRPVMHALPEVERQGFIDLLDRVFTTGEPFIGKATPLALQRIPDEPMQTTYLDFAYQAIRDDDGAITGIFVSGYEVTELRETQDRLRVAQQAGRIGSFELYPASRMLDVSAEFCRLWGLPATSRVALDDLIAMLHPSDRTQVQTIEPDIGQNALSYVEYRIRRGDTGEERWLARRGDSMQVTGSDLVRFVGVVYDITDRRRAEDDLRLLNDTLEQRVQERTAERDRMWRLSSDVMLVADFEGVVHAVNPAWTEMLGWTEEDLIGRVLLTLVHPDDIGSTVAEIGKLEQGVRTLRFENRYRHKDGHYRWLSWMAVPDAHFLHAVGRDVQAEKEAQAALESVQDALRQAQKMEAVGQLTGGIAHDFNNLLTIVTGNIEMATRALDAAAIVEPRSRRALENAMKGAERAASLTQRLLAFSRRQPLSPSALDADRLVTGLSEMVGRSLGETIRLEIVSTPGLWRIEADPNQLENAILNLAVNARDAMPGGGDLMIETANVRIDDAYTAAHAEVVVGHYVMIAVTDTGSGMSKDVIGRVFEPFFTTKEVGKGTGLGLSMVYGFVKQSGGHVKIYSEEGQGTTVKIYLPRLFGEVAPDAEVETGGAIAAGDRRETVLAVEDDEDVRAYTVECLRDLGYHVLEAHDGPSALALIERADGIDLMFTDVVMPGMSGSELAAAAQMLQPGLKILYTSGYTRNTIVHGGRLDAGVELIAKPFSYAALAHKIRDLLDGGR